MQTTPYPWPWDHDPAAPLTTDRLAVVVCGWQPFWASTVVTDPDVDADLDAATARIAGTVDALRDRGAAVLWVRTGAIGGPPRRPPHLPVVGSDEWRLIDGPVDGDLVVDTPGLDAFLVEWTDLELRSRGLDRLVLCGVGTEGPISSTNRSANDRGYECLLATDLCLHHDTATGDASLSSVCMSGGIFGAVGTASDLLAELA